MKKYPIIILLAAAFVFSDHGLLLAAEPKASDISVKGRAAPGSGIEQMKTYCLYKADAEKSADLYKDYQGLQNIIESELDSNFVEKGFTKSSGDRCDIEMRYSVAIDEQFQLKGKRQQAVVYRERDPHDRKDVSGRLRMGKIDLDAYEKSTNRHIWKGEAANTKGVYIDLKAPKEVDMAGVKERISVAFKRVFQRFPARTIN